MEPYDIEEKLIKAARLFKGLADEKFGPTDNWSIPAMQFRRARNGNADAKKSICLMVGAAVGLSTNEVAKIFDHLYGGMNENKRYKTVTNNMKGTIRLTESDLHRVIKESVKRIVNETIFNDDRGDLCWEPAEDTKYSIGPEGSNGWPNLLNKDDGSETGYQIYGWEELPNNRRYSLWNSKTGNSHDRIPESRLRRVVRESVKRAIKESVKRILRESDYDGYFDWAKNSGASPEDVENAGQRHDDRLKGNSCHGDKLAYKQRRYKMFDERGEDNKNKSALKKRTTKRLRDGWRF